MLERAARGWAAAPPWVENLLMGSHPREGRARRGRPVGRPWGVGRGAQIPLREHRRLAYSPYQKELTKGCLWGGGAPPNGVRLSCGAELEESQMEFYRRRRAPSASGAC